VGTTEYTEHTKNRLDDNALKFDLWVVTEVHQQRQTVPGGSKLIMNLRAVFVCQSWNGLNFDNNFSITDKIGYVAVLEQATLIVKLHGNLLLSWNTPDTEFNLQTILVYRLDKPAALFFINLKTSAYNLIAFV
jgi:hypothetical protein